MSTLAELFARDPRSFSGPQDPAIETIIARYREARAQFQLGDKKAGNTKEMNKGKAPKEKASAISAEELKALGLL